MKDATVPVGTSIEVLAPFLPYGIEVEQMAYTRDRVATRGIINDVCIWAGTVLLKGQEGYRGIKHLLPVLRPFSALCQPLEDGTVPVEILADVVKKSSRYMEIFLRGGAVVKERKDEGEGNPDRVEIWGEHTATAVFTIFSDFTFYTALQTDYAAISDTLRRLHFALPVNGRPLVEGVDYIAKSAPATPTKQEGGV